MAALVRIVASFPLCNQALASDCKEGALGVGVEVRATAELGIGHAPDSCSRHTLAELEAWRSLTSDIGHPDLRTGAPLVRLWCFPRGQDGQHGCAEGTYNC